MKGEIGRSRRPGKSKTRETLDEKKKRAAKVFRRLAKAYPEARCALDHGSPLELLVATVLSAQCTDVRVNMVTPSLFRRYRSAADYARAPAGELEEAIRSTGFFNAKARSLRRAGAAIAAEHGGKVPDTMEELVRLPGVGRKTANVILGNAFGKDEGFVVDTHVSRLARRLGFTRQTDPVKIEQDLMAIVPKGRRTMAAHELIFHGRRICVARRPRCEVCPVNPLCPKVGDEFYDPAADQKKDLTEEERLHFRRWKSESPERFRGVVRKIIAWDLGQIESRCDCVLAFWDESAARGGGTAAEITLAYRLGKLVYLVLGMPREAASGWILAAATEVFEDFDALRNFLRKSHGDSSSGTRGHGDAETR